MQQYYAGEIDILQTVLLKPEQPGGFNYEGSVKTSPQTPEGASVKDGVFIGGMNLLSAWH